VIAPSDASVDVSLSRNGTLVTKELIPLEEFEISRAGKTELEVSVKGAVPPQSLIVPIAERNVSQRAVITQSAENQLEIQVTQPTSVRARPQRSVNFVPRKNTPKKTTTTTTAPPSIEISEPD
jgi:hypothetical protein